MKGGTEYIMKKFVALLIVGVMTIGMTSMAAASPSASAVKASVSKEEAIAAAAASENMTVEEYVNNTVVSAPGVEDAVPMGVPSGGIVNGVKTNYSIVITKASKAVAAEAAQFGKVLNVFGVKNTPAGTVQITVYSSKIKAGQKLAAYQKVDGKWVKLVSSVRAEHIDVVLVGRGPLAIVAE